MQDKGIFSNFFLCLAPMVGLSHVALRRLLREYTPEGMNTLWPTEMLNSRRLPREKVGETPETLRAVGEDFLVPQILGNEENDIRESVRRLEDWGAYAIDINMGCPVQKALKHNYGVALMGDPDYAAEVVAMTARSTGLPVSVKLRAAGVKSEVSPELLMGFVEKLVGAGARWITLHPRTAEQKRRGSADWSQIKMLKEKIGVPVIGNGDIQTYQDVLSMQQSTGCDAVMAGRALAARPWMLWQLGEVWGFERPVLQMGKAPQTPEEEGAEYGRALLKLIDYMFEFFPEDLAVRKLKFYLRTTAVWLQFGHHLQAECSKAQNKAELVTAVVRFFSTEQIMYSYTELRQ